MTDSLTGHTAAEQFAAEAKKSGKEIVSTQFDPHGTTEYGSYITKIKSSGADSLYVFASGADGVAFVKQADQFKLFDQVKTVVGFSTFSEPVFPAMGNTIDGFYNNLNYSCELRQPAEQAVRRRLREEVRREGVVHPGRELHRRPVPLQCGPQGQERSRSRRSRRR